MYFKNILKNSFLALDEYYNINSIFNYNFIDGSLYKLSYVEKNSALFIGDFTIDNTLYSNKNSKYPENALKIELKKGNYRLLVSSGGIFNTETKMLNDSISSSKGIIKIENNVELDETDKNSIDENNFNDIISKYNDKFFNNYFDFKITSSSKFHIWVNNENTIGSLNFKIYKINPTENDYKIKELIFDKNTISSFKTLRNIIYDVTIDELVQEEFVKPKFKYPVGTYQVVLNDKISSNKDILSLVNIQSNDKQKFNINSSTNKLISLNSIAIPKDNNPLNFYFMLGKCELIVYIDFMNDKYYVYPNSYVECFMNLYLPDSKIEKIEESINYVKYKITEYKHISYNFRNKDEIIENLSKWINVDKNDIKYDNYELYFYAYNYNMNEYYMNNVVSKYINFDEYFEYLELDITCKIFDDVTIKYPDENITLDYQVVDYRENENNEPISGGLWKVAKTKPTEFNYINWSEPKKWENTNIENILISYVNGKGYIKISKQRFKNLFNIDLTHIKYGNFTDEQFKLLNLNDPLISPYNRFQYWINLNV